MVAETQALEGSRFSLHDRDLRAEISNAIESRTASIGVIGLGYVGLPLAQAFCETGFSVTGFDIDRGKIEQLERGESYIPRVTPEWLTTAQEEHRLTVSDDFRLLRQMNAVIICVPTPLTPTREPELSYVKRTATEIRRYLDRGQLIVLESTTYPGTTEEILRPILEESGLEVGRDVFLAYSPEREDPGNQKFGTSSIPKLVGGVDPVSGEIALELYRTAIEQVIPVSHARVAEASKILENVYRAVNIALVNELKVLFDRMGIDIWEVIEAAATKPFGFQAFFPGPGLGGHCVPIDPFYLSWKAKEYGMATKFVELAGEINTQMPHYVFQKVVEGLNRHKKSLQGSRGLVVGIAYKPNTADVRESPAFKIIELLEEQGCEVRFYDPHVSELPPLQNWKLSAQPAPLSDRVLEESDFALIVTHHDGIDWQFIVDRSSLVVDTRNATKGIENGRSKIIKA